MAATASGGDASSKLVSRRDLDFLLYEVLGAETLTERPRFAEHSRETFDAALDLSAGLAAEYFAPHNKLSDQNEPRLENGKVHVIPEVKAALAAFGAAGLIAAGHDERHGGMQLPATIAQACYAHFDAANIATTAYAFLTIANANLLTVYASDELKQRYLGPLLKGRFLGTMCLSEPDAGSSLGDIRTMAEPQPDGTYRIQGSKMWISGGDHELSENIVHLVLARMKGAPPGPHGLSLFLVPKRIVNADGSLGARNDVVAAGLNHKMGYRGTANCVLNFGEAGACTGFLVGAANKGLAAMFHMMNEARIVVGRGAVMLAYTGYLHALDYARTRRQGRLPGEKDASRPPVPLIEHADVRRMLLAQKAYVEGGLALCLAAARLLDDTKTAPEAGAREDAQLQLDVLTPIVKAWPSQWCLAANDLAIQVHGGYGYTREFNVEQFYRDNRLNPIHEGTNGIQALDLLGRKVVQKEGRAFASLVRVMTETAGQARSEPDPDLAEWGQRLEAAIADLEETTRVLHARNAPQTVLANASPYLDVFGHTVVAWLWLRQAMAARRALGGAGGSDVDFYGGKLQAARYFFRWELPKVVMQHPLLRAFDGSWADMKDAWF